MGFFDIADLMNSGVQLESTNRKNTDNDIDMDYFMKMLVAQLQNQDPMKPMDDSQFMTQMASISTMQALSDLSEVSMVSYAASLVGKEVTVAEYVDGKVQTTVGTVTGAGLFESQNVVYINGKTYTISQVMAVGKVPEKEKPEEKPEEDPEEKPEEKPEGGKSTTASV